MLLVTRASLLGIPSSRISLAECRIGRKCRAMAVFLSHARENGYKFPSPDLAGWPETPETSEILQRIKTIQRF